MFLHFLFLILALTYSDTAFSSEKKMHEISTSDSIRNKMEHLHDDKLDSIVSGKTITIFNLRTNKKYKIYYSNDGKKITEGGISNITWELTDGEGISEYSTNGEIKTLWLFRLNKTIYMCRPRSDCYMIIVKSENGNTINTDNYK